MSEELQFRTCKLWRTIVQVLVCLGEQRRETLLYRQKGDIWRGCCKQNVHWKKLGVPSVVTSH